MPNRERKNAATVCLPVFISFVFALVLLFNMTGALADRTPGDFNYMQGEDLPGQDYKAFFTKAYPYSGDSILECEEACKNDPQCLAYTWVRPGVKGTNAACYLKSGVPVWTPNGDCCSGVRRGVSVTGLFNINQGMKSTEYIYKNFSFVGYEDKCERACANDPKCLAFTYAAPTWVGPGQPAYDLCYLMSGVPTLTQDPNFVSGVRITATAPLPLSDKFYIFQGTDLQHEDYYKYTTKRDYADCDNACAKDPKCMAYTWVKPGVQGTDAVCWLKSGVPNPTQNPNCVSGVRKGITVTGLFDIKKGIDMRAGHAYRNFSMKSDPFECEKTCASDPKCLSYTQAVVNLGSPKSGLPATAIATCSLMSDVPNPTQNPDCVSGVRIVPKVAAKSYTVEKKKEEKEKDISSAKSLSAAAAQKSSSTSAAPSAIPKISGQWKGSNGLVYDIKQFGDRFEWTVKDKNEKADGVIKGNNLYASWQRELKSGSLEGKIMATDLKGKPTQIDWNNGMRFYRMAEAR